MAKSLADIFGQPKQQERKSLGDIFGSKATVKPALAQPKGDQRDDVTFLGSEQAGKFASSYFPRTAKAVGEGEGFGKQFLSAGADLLSLPGRSLTAKAKGLASLPGRVGEAKGFGGVVKELAAPFGGKEEFQAEQSKIKGDGFVEGITRSPQLGAAVLTAPLSAAAGGLIKGGQLAARSAQGLLAGATEGAVSSAVTQAENIREGKGVSGKQAALEFGASAATGGLVPGLGSAISSGVSGANKIIGRLAGALSGVSEEALRKSGLPFSKGSKELIEASGTQKEIGQELLHSLDNLDEFLPEKDVIKKALGDMPGVNVRNTIDALEGSRVKGVLFDSDEAANRTIDKLVTALAEKADKTGNIPANEFRKIRIRIDKKIGDAFGKESNEMISSLKGARHQMAEDLVETARAGGKPEYVDAMIALRDKMQAVSKLKDFLGATSRSQERRVESFMANIFNKNKSEQQKVLGELSDIFGNDFVGKAKKAQLAAQLGPEGKPGLLPQQFTGRAVLGSGLAASLGGLAGPGILPFALSSPRIAATTLGTLDKAGQLSRKIPTRGLAPLSRGLSRELAR